MGEKLEILITRQKSWKPFRKKY